MKSKSTADLTDRTKKHNMPQRISFPEDEAAHPWLSMLLDAYFIVDGGVVEGIRREGKRGRKLACRKNCPACCRTHTTIPVYPLELVGMTWYAIEKVQRLQRKKLARQLKNYKGSDACPFLVGDVCSIHPLRPVACRQFNVLDEICAEGEDTYYTRRKDVLTPIKKYTDRAFNVMLPFYGAKTRAQRRKVIKSGAIHVMAREMLSCNWSGMADKMKEYERQHPQAF